MLPMLRKYTPLGGKNEVSDLFDKIWRNRNQRKEPLYVRGCLVRQIRHSLKDLDGLFHTYKAQGRVYVDCDGDYDGDEVVEALKRVFGIVGICPVVRVEDKGFEELKKDVIAYMDEVYPDKNITFKVESRRAKKPIRRNQWRSIMTSEKLFCMHSPEIRVDVHHPDVLLHVEVREEIYIYSEIIPGPGGMPIGTNGNCNASAFRWNRQSGCRLHDLQTWRRTGGNLFHAPPYTSERAKQKVVDLAKQVSKYTGPIKLHVVNFTDIQLYIYEKCPHDELTIIMRRYMMRIAEHFAKNGCLGLITGESIGQVASQTMQSLMATNDVCTLPVYRPLIGFDKQEIVDISEDRNL